MSAERHHADAPPDKELLRQEEARLRRLRLIVNSACHRLRYYVGSPERAIDLIVETKARALEIFPDKAPQFDLIYLPRLLRIVHERWGSAAPRVRRSTHTLLPGK